ncbi:MAG: DEAD/DEAH box helicase [Thermoplasmatales archaeon]|jgi:ATP-dependent Lhr-like helicase|nr:DEAD/DEAH box helicase [Candidatus Thermoplasmatota archaeon]MCL6003574.1 DEAD/DEAH box helicase [Candidatus Thermoplasmatota archaeon]MDA8054247.1 DEAD/DEAH box helicase [Thermoplasmatales archaeon]
MGKQTGVEEKLLEVLRARGFSDFTEPQKIGIPEILKNQNVLLTSPTGSGKTEAAVLPVFYRLSEMKDQIGGFGAIYITPLRALNRDVLSRIEFYGEAFGLEVGVRHGDSSESERRYQLLHPPQVLITTPETLQLIASGKKIRNHLRSVKYVIIDEVHELLNDERGWQLMIGLSRMKEISPGFKIIAISATIGNPEEVSKNLFFEKEYKVLKAGTSKRYEINVSMPNGASPSFKDTIGSDENYAQIVDYIMKLYNSNRQFIVFSNTRATAEDIVMRLRLVDENILVEVHHGSLGKDVRTKIEEDFKRGKLKGIICTSSMELGIDVGSVDFVAQVNSPRQVIRLVQRVGRGKHRLAETSRGEIVAMNEIESEEGGVISKFAENNSIENVRVREKPLIVTANQIVALVHSEREISLDKALEIFHRVNNFGTLTSEEFESLVTFLSSIYVIRYDPETKVIRKSGRTLKYFIENISMIPDEKRYVVKESSTAKIIGFLDEGYVATEIDVGSTFTLKGSTWRVLGIKERYIYVDFIQGISVPPSWSGEEIPVPYEIAMEVGKERRENFLNDNLDDFTKEKVREFRKSVANDHLVRVEKEGVTTVIQITAGTKANYTLALIITFRLSEKYGESFLFDNSPYHIVIQGNTRYRSDEIVDILEHMQDEFPNLDRYVEKSRTFQYSTVNVAKKFGVISKESDFTRIRMDRIFSSHRDTPFFKEALDKFKWDYLDVENLSKISDMIASGRMVIETKSAFSNSSKLYMNSLKEKMMPIRPTAPILSAVRRRLLSEEMAFYCLSCHRVFKSRIQDMKDRRCIFCSSPRIAPIKPYEIENMNKPSGDTLRKIRTSYHLLRMYEDKALLVLAAHGIGPESASRILEVPIKSENELLEKILINEVEFAKNRRFWT